jgi:hypothetical protein
MRDSLDTKRGSNFAPFERRALCTKKLFTPLMGGKAYEIRVHECIITVQYFTVVKRISSSNILFSSFHNVLNFHFFLQLKILSLALSLHLSHSFVVVSRRRPPFNLITLVLLNTEIQRKRIRGSTSGVENEFRKTISARTWVVRILRIIYVVYRRKI